MTLTVPDVGERLPTIVLVRGMALAVIFTWCRVTQSGHCRAKRPRSRPPSALDSPVAAAAVGTATSFRLMLVYLLVRPDRRDSGPADDRSDRREDGGGARRGERLGKLIGNFLGGFVAVAGYYLLQISPSLATLALITFIIGVGFAVQIAKGGVRGGNRLLAYNATIVILGLALLKDPAQFGNLGRAGRAVRNCLHIRGRHDGAALAAREDRAFAGQF